jgi:hypothetical protein
VSCRPRGRATAGQAVGARSEVDQVRSSRSLSAAVENLDKFGLKSGHL